VARNLWFGAKVGLISVWKKDFDLNTHSNDTFSSSGPVLAMSLLHRPTDNTSLFLSVATSQRFLKDEAGETKIEIRIVPVELNFSWNNIVEGVDAKIGRQRFTDSRKWLYNDYLDAARLFYGLSDLRFELSAAQKRQLNFLQDGNQSTSNAFIFHSSYNINPKNVLAAYVLVERDGGVYRGNPVFFGIHEDGIIGRLSHWLEVAHVGGSNNGRKISGNGFDIGSTYAFPLPLRPSVTLAYARGSGDKTPNSGADKSFRQTDLLREKNVSTFNGVALLKYYGTALDPELSNIGIVTAGLGIRPIRHTSLDLVYHHYRQQEASATILNSNLTRPANGLNKDIGNEADIIAAYAGTHVKVKLEVGYFVPGAAFRSDSDKAIITRLSMQYEF
jgi:alginate production protein